MGRPLPHWRWHQHQPGSSEVSLGVRARSTVSFSKRADSPAAPRRVPTNRDASGRLKTRYEDPGAREALKQAAAGGGGTTDLWRRLRSLAQVLEPSMGMGTKLAIGLLGMSIDMGWYVFVALVLTGTGAVDWLRAKGVLIYRITAVALWLFAASVMFTLV